MALEKRDSGPEYVALRLEELLKPKRGKGESLKGTIPRLLPRKGDVPRRLPAQNPHKNASHPCEKKSVSS
jgi:hypothetical protein